MSKWVKFNRWDKKTWPKKCETRVLAINNEKLLNVCYKTKKNTIYRGSMTSDYVFNELREQELLTIHHIWDDGTITHWMKLPEPPEDL